MVTIGYHRDFQPNINFRQLRLRGPLRASTGPGTNRVLGLEFLHLSVKKVQNKLARASSGLFVSVS